MLPASFRRFHIHTGNLRSEAAEAIHWDAFRTTYTVRIPTLYGDPWLERMVPLAAADGAAVARAAAAWKSNPAWMAQCLSVAVGTTPLGKSAVGAAQPVQMAVLRLLSKAFLAG